MSAGEVGERASPPLPGSIWVVAWASLAGQALLLARWGPRDGDELSLVVSVVLGALVVGWVSAGVVRARTVRLVLAWVVLLLSLIAELASVTSVVGPGDAALALLSLTTTVAALVGLAVFHHTDWYAWQRTRPSDRSSESLGALIAIGVGVGALGGMTGPVEDGFDVRISTADR